MIPDCPINGQAPSNLRENRTWWWIRQDYHALLNPYRVMDRYLSDEAEGNQGGDRKYVKCKPRRFRAFPQNLFS